MPIRRRHTGTSVTSAPPMRTLPSSGLTKPAMTRRSVVLPDPDGPSRLVRRPSSRPALTESSTRPAPKLFVTARTSTPVTQAPHVGEPGEGQHQHHGGAEQDRRNG